MIFPNTQVLNHKEYIKDGKRHIDVTLIGQALPKDSLMAAMITRMDSVGLGGTVLNIKQGFSIDGTTVADPADSSRFYAMLQSQIDARQHTIDSLNYVLYARREFSDDAVVISPEVKVLFPSVKGIALSRLIASSTDADRCDTISVVFINAPAGISRDNIEKLDRYLQVRLSDPTIRSVVNPSGFPWPAE